MYNIRNLKFIILFIGVTLVSFTSNITIKSMASTEKSCVQDAGYFYIIDQYQTNRATANLYYTRGECEAAALNLYGCNPSIQGQQFMARGVSYGIITGIDYLRDRVTEDYRNRCINSISRDENTCETEHYRYFTCNCKKSTSTWYSSLGLSRSWTNLEGIRYECGLEEFVLSDLRTLGTTKEMSPLVVIQQITKLVFAIGIFLFIINFLQGAVLYVRSNGEESGLKQARHKVTISIAGLIFMFFVTGVIMFTYGIISRAQ